MTRKDFELIASTLLRASKTPGHFYVSGEDSQYLQGVRSAAVALANELKATNPRFDRERFLEACGIVS